MNGVDPLGLFLFGGLGLATGIAVAGSGIAGLAADGLGALFNKNSDDPLKATKGVAKGMAGAAAVNAGIATGATGVAGAAKAAPAVIAAAPALIRQGKNAVKAVGNKARQIGKAGIDWAKTNPEKVDKVGRVSADLIDPNMPPQTPEGQTLAAGRYLSNKYYKYFKGRHE